MVSGTVFFGSFVPIFSVASRIPYGAIQRTIINQLDYVDEIIAIKCALTIGDYTVELNVFVPYGIGKVRNQHIHIGFITIILL